MRADAAVLVPNERTIPLAQHTAGGRARASAIAASIKKG